MAAQKPTKSLQKLRSPFSFGVQAFVAPAENPTSADIMPVTEKGKQCMPSFREGLSKLVLTLLRGMENIFTEEQELAAYFLVTSGGISSSLFAKQQAIEPSKPPIDSKPQTIYKDTRICCSPLNHWGHRCKHRPDLEPFILFIRQNPLQSQLPETLLKGGTRRT